jgi:hypothetical protein
MGRIWRQVSLRTRHALAWAAAASILAPWLVGELVKTFHQPGLSNDPQRAAMFIDILVIAVGIFSLTMVFTVMMGCLITAALKGPRYFGDVFPDAPQAQRHEHRP